MHIYFDHRSNRYRVCCCVHSTKATKCVAITEMVINMLGFSISIAGHHYNYVTLSQLVGSLVNFVVSTFVSVLLLMGIRARKPGYLIPYLVVCVIQIIACGFGIAASLLTLAAGMVRADHSLLQNTPLGNWTTHNFNITADFQLISLDQDTGVGVVIGVSATLVVLLLITLAVLVAFFVIVLRAYRYLRDQLMSVGVCGGSEYSASSEANIHGGGLKTSKRPSETE